MIPRALFYVVMLRAPPRLRPLLQNDGRRGNPPKPDASHPPEPPSSSRSSGVLGGAGVSGDAGVSGLAGVSGVSGVFGVSGVPGVLGAPPPVALKLKGPAVPV